jgi:hypothetical protein
VAKSCEIYALHLGDHRYRYVGLTTVGSADRLWMHRKNARQDRLDWPVYRWMRKHGPENVHIEVLETVDSREALDGREIHWIDRLATEGFDLLNCTAGGGGMRTVSPEVRAKIGPRRGSRLSSEHLAKLRGENNHFYGKRHSPETRAKMGANNGMKRPEVAAKISATKTGVKRPPEVGRRISETKILNGHLRHCIDVDKWTPSCVYCAIEIA